MSTIFSVVLRIASYCRLSVDDEFRNRTIVDLATRMIDAERKCADAEKKLEKVAREKMEIALVCLFMRLSKR